MSEQTTKKTLHAWILTDGKIGDRVQCLGIAQQLNAQITEKVLQPSWPWVWLMPQGPLPPQHYPGNVNSPIHGPFPDIVIASGRRVYGYLPVIKKASQQQCFTVYLKDPKCNVNYADLIWVPWHDRLRSNNTFVTATTPHTINHHTLEHAKQAPQPWRHDLTSPTLGIVLGDPIGRARHQTNALNVFIEKIKKIQQQVGSCIIVQSRRTPQNVIDALHQALAGSNYWLWSGQGDNPYLKVLAHADILMVTADSHNMISEALVTGKPTYTLDAVHTNPKLKKLIRRLEEEGKIRVFNEKIDFFNTAPINATEEIAKHIQQRMQKNMAPQYTAD
jgi:mitochondrial fission protein ELM1